MENKDIEKKLKNSASKIEMKDFSERWENVGTRIDLYDDGKENVLYKEPVLAASDGVNVKVSNRLKSSWTIVVAALLIIGIILAIVLPIVLREDDYGYFNYYELTEKIVSEDEFDNKIADSGLNTVNISDYEFSLYKLLLTPNNYVVGGAVEFLDEEEGIYFFINFHKKIVISEYDIGLVYNEYTVGNTIIKYKTTVEEDIYSTVATTTYRDLIYEIEYISFDENIENLFDKLFN